MGGASTDGSARTPDGPEGQGAGAGARAGRSRSRRLPALGAVAGCALLLAACGGGGGEEGARGGPAPSARKAPAVRPVPAGKGSKTESDFNGDGARDLVLNDLVKADSHGDDTGIGIVYGSASAEGSGSEATDAPDDEKAGAGTGGADDANGGGLRPAVRQLLTPAAQAARVKGELPATFDAEAVCDLDRDGFSDLVVSTDPPYDGQGRPPVPLQLLFGSPKGLTGKAVVLRIPDRARYGNDWPDQPVCGDFDGDGTADLVVHATGGRLSFLRGPFSRAGAPRAAGKALRSPGSVPTGPAADIDGDGYDDLLVRAGGQNSASSVVLGSAKGPNTTGVLLPAGTGAVFGDFGRGKGTDAAIGTPTAVALRYEIPGTRRGTLDLPGTELHAADFDGDGTDDLVTGGKRIRILPGGPKGLTTTDAVTVRPPASGGTRVLETADFDGDGRADLVLRTVRGDAADTIAVYPGREDGLVAERPEVTFSTSEFLGME
ncbi:FG-GAP repeat domain-containing protein [Streptomyces physcomitrii]|uniref:VCBS repeat-containing protein n=1 Tax=Streptomyces physcomitrii TaxID=2724184 RepID=A0ABX1H090_9ACTN|nr:VCBS repeat-containing protein [Streptomyces physcomitrii]NKI41751.1 VCBS repeat-containing protein [Streptomyces physcomitrii]